jgi:hypothetical protein
VVVVVVEVVGAVVVVLPGPVVEGEVLDDGTVVGALDGPESPQPTKSISAAMITVYRQSFDVIAFPVLVWTTLRRRRRSVSGRRSRLGRRTFDSPAIACRVCTITVLQRQLSAREVRHGLLRALVQ